MTKRNHEWRREQVLFPTGKTLWCRPVLFVVMLMLAPMVIAGEALQPASSQNKVGPGIREALRTAGEAHVVIALKHPPSLKAPLRNALSSMRREVASMQADVLAHLYASEYREKYRYQAIPALAGRILSEDALAKFAAHSNVIKVDLDVSGTGGLTSRTSGRI